MIADLPSPGLLGGLSQIAARHGAADRGQGAHYDRTGSARTLSYQGRNLL